MKKTVFFAAMLAFASMMTSCLRDDDLEMLKHPIHVVGTVDPAWGVPVAYGEMNMSDILSHFSSTYTGLINPDSNVITISYDMSARDTIWAFSALKKSAPQGKAGGNWRKSGTIFTKDSVVWDTIDIDLFDDMESIQHFSISHAWLDLAVAAYSDYCPEMVRRNSTVVFDSLEIWYDDHNGVHTPFNNSSLLDFSVLIDDLTEGFHKNFPKIDIASIVNAFPSRIYTKYHFKMNVSDSIIKQNIFSMPLSQILDSMRMTKLIYAADLGVEIPLSMQVSNWKDTFNVALGEGFASLNLDSIVKTINEGISVNMDSAKFTLNLENGIPLGFTLSAYLYDDNNILRWTAFTNEPVSPANLGRNTDGSYYATSPKRTTLTTKLNNNDIENMSKATTMRVVLNIDSDGKHVVVDKDDNIKLQAFIRINPRADVDISITNGGLLK